jgi:two-component sensor histidine kinase
MQMQSRRATQLETKELLKDSENRLLALSKVHRNLKQGDNSSIRIEQYLSDIIDNLQSAFQSDYKKMTLDKDIKNLEIDAESTMRIGLIINELITNSMKHIDKPEVNIKISLNQSDNDKITLRYQDNGSGIERLLNSNKSKDSMGLHLIDILRKQLRGKVDIVLV